MRKKRHYLVIKTLIIFICFYAVAGCTHYYTPTETTFPINESMVADFTGKGSITIKNMQPHGKEIVFYSKSGDNWKGDLGKWTETAVNYFTLELTKRNFIITDSAAKILNVSITDAIGQHASGSFMLDCKLKMKVETGDGYVREFEVINASPIVTRAVDGAVMKAVVAALNAPEIIAYFEK